MPNSSEKKSQFVATMTPGNMVPTVAAAEELAISSAAAGVIVVGATIPSSPYTSYNFVFYQSVN